MLLLLMSNTKLQLYLEIKLTSLALQLHTFTSRIVGFQEQTGQFSQNVGFYLIVRGNE